MKRVICYPPIFKEQTFKLIEGFDQMRHFFPVLIFLPVDMRHVLCKTQVSKVYMAVKLVSASKLSWDFQPLMEDAVQTPLEEDAVDHGSSDESIPHRNSHPRLSNVDLPDSEDALSAPHLRRRESAVPPTVTTMCPPNITPVQTARSLYRTTAAELFDYIWPPDFFLLAQHARWLLVRILIIAAVWCVVQAFMAPADAQMQYSSSLSFPEVQEADFHKL